jgi:hypothetical protein
MIVFWLRDDIMTTTLTDAWAVYRCVSRNRHRMPGSTAACALPPRNS